MLGAVVPAVAGGLPAHSVSRSGTVEIYSVAQGAAAAQLFERLPAVAMLHRAAVRTNTCIGVQMAKADRAGFGRPLALALAAASGGLSAGAAAAAPVPAAPGKKVKATPFLVQLSIGGGGVIVATPGHGSGSGYVVGDSVRISQGAGSCTATVRWRACIACCGNRALY